MLHGLENNDQVSEFVSLFFSNKRVLWIIFMEFVRKLLQYSKDNLRVHSS